MQNAPYEVIRGEIEDAPYIYIEHPEATWLWFAHTDVVPAQQHQFVLEQDGDTLRGRGVKDMKGAALPFLMAYRDAIARGENPPVSILLTSDEEVAGPTIPELLKADIVHAPVAFTPDSGASPSICTEHKGVIWTKLSVQGQSSHSAIPWEGKNPIPLLADAISKLNEAFPLVKETDWGITVTPTQLQGSDTRNQIPAKAFCNVDIRYPASEGSSTEVLQKVSAALPDGCELSIEIDASPLNTDPSHSLVQTVKTLAEKIEEKDIPLEREHGATDARFFGDAGIPAFIYGPIGGGLHSKDEWVSHSSLVNHYTLSEELLRTYR